MSKQAMLLFRISGAFFGGAIFFAAILLIETIGMVTLSDELYLIVIAACIVGGVFGMLWMPSTIHRWQTNLMSLTAQELTSMTVGVVVGLMISVLITIPLQQLPNPIGQIMPAACMLIFSYLGATISLKRPHDLYRWLASFRGLQPNGDAKHDTNDKANQDMIGNVSSGIEILLDTSVIIDGRITDISKTGFINSSLIVPNFVLNELQNIADSPDPVRRKRGRRGLDILDVLQNDCPIPLEIRDIDVSEVREVDAKLVALARHTKAQIMTNDYNLNRVASLQGVSVLNINDLANAVKAAHLPGEELVTKVIQEGREHNQGIGYLEDGTMVVVEDGIRYMNQTMHVIVTKVLQTSAGRMIFTRVP